jgi:heterodisulfide reductase subunit A
VGNYTVTVKRKPRYVNEDLCVGCQECIQACVFKEPKFADEFNVGLSKRKPIYIPFPQAVPQVVVVDPERCLKLKTGKCKQTCVEACADRQAIDFTQKEELIEIKVGNIIVATGFNLFDAKRIPQYGYGLYPNVFTSLELERLVTSSGPTGGEVVMRDGRTPKSVGFILCVGSRDMKTNRWCSRTCCMHSMKLAQLVREHTGADVTVFYLDIRAPGKGCEEFYDRSLKEGIQFVRGRVAEVTDWALAPEEEDKLVIRVEDTLAGFVRRIPVDMIVLAVGMEPQTDAQDIRRLFNMSCGSEGWFLEKHPKLAPVSTFTDGVFIAGCCQGPKDIPDSIAQAGAAAAEAMALIDKGHIEQEPNTAYIVEEECSGCKSCIPLCPFTAITFDVVTQKAHINEALCKGCGTCVASCPSGSIRQNLFEDEEIFGEIEGVLAL